MPRWLTKVLATVHEQAAASRIRLTAKANRELRELGAGLDRDDVREILLGLAASDSVGRLASEATGEWMYVFKPRVGGDTLYLKLILRSECVVLSLHEDEVDEKSRNQD